MSLPVKLKIGLSCVFFCQSNEHFQHVVSWEEPFVTKTAQRDNGCYTHKKCCGGGCSYETEKAIEMGAALTDNSIFEYVFNGMREFWAEC